MADSKKALEDAIWEFVARHRPLKLAAIVVLGLGSITGAITALEKPARWILNGASYVFGARPKADDVLIERNAFMAGSLLREIWYASPGSANLESTLNYVEKAYTALGMPDTEIKVLRTAQSDTIPNEQLQRIRQRIEGYLEGKGTRYKAFFELGFHIRSLIDATSPYRTDGPVREVNDFVLKAYALAQDGSPFRLPKLPLQTLEKDKPVPEDYLAQVIESYKLLRMFLSIAT